MGKGVIIKSHELAFTVAGHEFTLPTTFGA
jgi:hypothetical protein